MDDLADEPTEYEVAETRQDFVSRRVIDVRTDEVTMPAGSTATRDVVVHPGAVGIVALDRNERVLLLQQYRHAVRRLLWEPPAGLLDEPGESPLAAAQRELFEEAHLEAADWRVLVDAFTSPGMTDEAVRIYLARDVREATGAKYEGEHEEADMPVRWIPLDAAVEAIQAGQIHNPLAVMGLLATAVARARGFDQLRPASVAWPEMSAFPGSAAAHSQH
jgi:ADP-ribose pyrophosphatase